MALRSNEYSIPEYAADNEDKRITKIFNQLGVETVTPKSKKQFKIKPDGVYIAHEKSNGETVEEKVGFIFLNGEHAWVDPTHPAAHQRNMLEAASEFIKDRKIPLNLRTEIGEILNRLDPQTFLPDFTKLEKILTKLDFEPDPDMARLNAGLIDAILKGKVLSNYSPGIDFVGDKEFYVYVEDMIRLYLHEEPIIKNIETQKFNKKNSRTLDEALLKTVLDHLDQYVIKKVDGRGGDSVWVGPKVKVSELSGVIAAIRANPDLYIVQKYTPLSTLNENIVDLRVITDVGPDKILVTDTPWGRGLPVSGNGKVNISDQGREIAVLVVPEQKPIVRLCSRVYAN